MVTAIRGMDVRILKRLRTNSCKCSTADLRCKFSLPFTFKSVTGRILVKFLICDFFTKLCLHIHMFFKMGQK